MKTILTLLLSIFFTGLSYGQFVAKMEVKEPIPGICNDKNVIAILPFDGQKEAVCPITEDEITERLNQIEFLKQNPKHKDKGMIGLIINCKGEVVQCKMDNETKSLELDKQIEEVFNNLGEWKPGKLNGKKVDTSKLYSFKISKGKITLE
ncbi:MAG: hypothetical protein ABFS32_13490 [Bacteroidota bacterium]